MKPSSKFILANAFTLFVASIAHAADPADFGGFILGSTLEEAQSHAIEQEWILTPMSENLPGSWIVKGTELSLYICNGVVTSVNEMLVGDFEQFTKLVFSMILKFGQPNIQIVNFPSAFGYISTIDVNFENVGERVFVQLQSIGGKRTFSTSRWIESECGQVAASNLSE